MNIANNQAHVCFDPALYRRLLHRDRVDVWRLFGHAKPREVSRKRIGAFGAAAVYFRRGCGAARWHRRKPYGDADGCRHCISAVICFKALAGRAAQA